MSQWRAALKERLAPLGLRPEREAEIIDELSQHLDDHVRELVAGGSDPALARAEALAELDAPGALARRLEDIESRPPLTLPPPGAPSRGRFLHARWLDVRHSLRSLRRSPGFAATVLATFALTIGPTTAILSFGNWLLWRPAPGVHDPDRLAVIWIGQWRQSASGTSFSPASVSYLNLDDLRRTSKTLTGIAGVMEDNVNIAADGLAPAPTGAGAITADALDVLGVPVIAGRPFGREDDQEPNGNKVILIREGLARRGFGSAAGALNQRLLLNGRPLSIVGVVPETFAGTNPMRRISVWYPGATIGYVGHFVERDKPTRSDGRFYSFVARLAPGATFESAQAELDVLVPALAEAHPDENGQFKQARARLFPGLGPNELQRASYAKTVRVLLAIGGVLLLLGCANVANMLIMRGVRLGRDRAIRLALGASRARLVVLQLTESALLAAGGAALGILIAMWMKGLIVALLFPAVTSGFEFDVPLDARVLGMTLAVSIVCGLLAGLAPALAGRRASLAPSLAGVSRSHTGQQWLRSAFAGVQLALSVALVTGSLLLVTTLRNFQSVQLGFEPAGVTRHHIDPSRQGYTPERLLVYFQEVVQKLSGRPGIAAASVSGRIPFGSSWRMRMTDPAGADRPPIQVLSNNVSAGYFDVLRMRVVHGRTFTDAEAMTTAAASTFPVVIGEGLSQRLFAGANAIGRTIALPAGGNAPARDVIVIGVVEDVYWNNLTERPLFLYQPFPQRPGAASILVRSTLPASEVSSIVSAAAREVDASLPLSFSQPISDQIETEFSEQRTFAWVLSLVGWMAFALAAIGLYGLLAQSVSERTREFGIRLAVGSGQARIFGLVLRQAAWIGLAGGVAGVALAVFGTRLIEAQLFGVTRLDVTTYALAAGALVLVVFVAGLWPARSATRIQPVEALRVE